MFIDIFQLRLVNIFNKKVNSNVKKEKISNVIKKKENTNVIYSYLYFPCHWYPRFHASIIYILNVLTLRVILSSTYIRNYF